VLVSPLRGQTLLVHEEPGALERLGHTRPLPPLGGVKQPARPSV
jgi:hypothetical protein